MLTQLRTLPKNVKLVGIAVTLFVVAFMIHWYFSAAAIRTAGPYYYSTDNGRTFFRSDAIYIPPFKWKGKIALQAGVFVAAGGRPVIAYVFKYTLAGRDMLLALPRRKGRIMDSSSLRFQAAAYCLVRKPGHKKWVPWNSPEGQQIVNVRDPATGQPAKPYDGS